MRWMPRAGARLSRAPVPLFVFVDAAALHRIRQSMGGAQVQHAPIARTACWRCTIRRSRSNVETEVRITQLLRIAGPGFANSVGPVPEPQFEGWAQLRGKTVAVDRINIDDAILFFTAGAHDDCLGAGFLEQQIVTLTGRIERQNNGCERVFGAVSVVGKHVVDQR